MKTKQIREIRWISAVLFILLWLSVLGCESDGVAPGSSGRLVIYISDAPGQFDEVNISISRVEAHKEGGGWFVVNDEPQTFDLLELSNGVTAVLGDAHLEAGFYTQLRLIINEGSNVLTGGNSYPLTISSGEQTGVKLVHAFDIEPDYTYELLLDFDVHHSIHSSALGYMLKPVIRVEALAQTGAIRGSIQQDDAGSVVILYSGEETVTSVYPDIADGSFKFIGIPQGTYSLTVEAEGYQAEHITGLVVQVGETTDAGTIVLTETE